LKFSQPYRAKNLSNLNKPPKSKPYYLILLCKNPNLVVMNGIQNTEKIQKLYGYFPIQLRCNMVETLSLRSMIRLYKMSEKCLHNSYSFQFFFGKKTSSCCNILRCFFLQVSDAFPEVPGTSPKLPGAFPKLPGAFPEMSGAFPKK
jgi:hypothetical protein